MIKRISILILWCISSQITASPAEINDNLPMTEARRTLQESSREINQLIEQRRYQQLKQPANTVPESTSAPALPESRQCLLLTGVYLKGISLLSVRDLNTLSALSPECISSHDINRLSHELTRLYISKGYITARIQFIAPDADGELGLNVIEGFIEKIEGGDRWVNSSMLFPGLEKQPLNITQLDQGLDQANRLQSNKTTLDILPGTVNGGSVIKLHNQHSKPWLLNIITDNYGQKSTGKWLARTNASFDSPFGLSDFISLNVSSTLDSPSNRYSRAATLLYSVPYGAATFSGFGSYSQYASHPHLQNKTVKIYGNTQQVGMRSDFAFYRNQSQINTVSGQLIYKNYNNYIGDAKIGVSSQTLSVFELGVNHLQIIPTGLITLNLSVEQGLPWFGAQTATTYLNEQFTKGKLMVNLYQRFTLFNSPYQLNNLFYGQYNRRSLPGVEWLNISDRNAVRGFSKNTLSGDNGWYLQNTLSRTFPIANSTLSMRIGIDVGQVQGYRSPQGWQSSAGISTGATLRYQRMVFDIEASRGKWLSNRKAVDEPVQVLTRFSYTF
ncbi:ShlB/FhaC/HecB family hemolysin secretion/activation protein [Photorhabdus heterorhabditis]|uniref:ShlB/FhaC/HecB family hemolysin secretion/activation protein n=1 Tax=Photorhabdus heterorhabditis TaxID=880156 RepID=UPI0015626D47|nr:ShlB/FhaC/HecB family hemolysin secretion/activation protein [Photorhabdus heterorhabditis]NRN27664.1 ShlB/FhaC/HecB family hemolysin secretion/activation protein [Photorhabdus heterorhabditis subsp. aluminescens]